MRIFGFSTLIERGLTRCAAGVLLSPWFPTQASHELIDADRSYLILNTFTVGIIVFGLAQLQYVALQRAVDRTSGVADRLALPVRLPAICEFYHSSLGESSS